MIHADVPRCNIEFPEVLSMDNDEFQPRLEDCENFQQMMSGTSGPLNWGDLSSAEAHDLVWSKTGSSPER